MRTRSSHFSAKSENWALLLNLLFANNNSSALKNQPTQQRLILKHNNAGWDTVQKTIEFLDQQNIKLSDYSSINIKQIRTCGPRFQSPNEVVNDFKVTILTVIYRRASIVTKFLTAIKQFEITQYVDRISCDFQGSFMTT